MGRSVNVFYSTTPQLLIFAGCVAMVCYTILRIKEKD